MNFGFTFDILSIGILIVIALLIVRFWTHSESRLAKNISNENKALIILLMLACLATLGIFAMCHPFQGVKLAVKLYAIAFIFTLIVAIAVSVCSGSGEAISPEGSASLIPFVTDRCLVICAILALPFMDSVIAVNTWCDTSAATRMTATVLSKNTLTYRYSSEGVTEVSISSPISSPSPSTIRDTEDFVLPDVAYVLVVPGKTMIEFNMHPGFLGFPWYEGGYRVIY